MAPGQPNRSADGAGAAEPEPEAGLDGAVDEDAGPGAPVAEPEPEPAVAPAAPSRRKSRGRDAAKPVAAAPSVAEEAVHITDRASAVFVIGVTLVFVVILLNGMLLGKRGFITQALATPKPTPGVTASPVASASPSASVTVSEAPSASPAASESAAPASAEPSPSPSAS